jgi:uncharacterized protein
MTSLTQAIAQAHTRTSSEAEINALALTCEQLQGFGFEMGIEGTDGFLTALAAGPRVPDVAQWLPALAGDAFDRAFADPLSHAQALRSLQTRLKILCEQLNPEALFDDLEQLRIEPVMMEWTEADRERVRSEAGSSNPGANNEGSEDPAALLQVGAEWAGGFFAALEAFEDLWAVDESTDWFDTSEQLLEQVMALMYAPGSTEYLQHIETFYTRADRPGVPPEPTRDDLLSEASFAVQDLRLLWADNAPKAATRRVEATPGRNDPCHCGSGKKFKKCHGAAA